MSIEPQSKTSSSEGLDVVIEFANDKQVRARKVVKRSNHRVTGKFPSWKAGRMLQWESSIERDAFILLEADTSVRQYREQPAKLTFNLAGQKRIHYPDIYAETDKERCFIEVKSKSELDNPEIIERTSFLSTALTIQGDSYYLLGETEIRRQPRLHNAMFLHRHSRFANLIKLDWLKREQLRKVIKNSGGITINAIREGKLGEHGLISVCRMIQEGHLWLDKDTEWNNTSVITTK